MFNHEACVILLELREAFDYLFGVLPALKDLNVPVHYLEFFFLLVHFLLQRSLEVDIASFLFLTLLRNRWKQAIVKPERIRVVHGIHGFFRRRLKNLLHC